MKDGIGAMHEGAGRCRLTIGLVTETSGFND